MYKSVGIIARYDKKQALTLAEELADYLTRKGLEVYLEDTLRNKVRNQGKFIPLKEMKTDFIITIGGDGTILRTCLTLSKPEPPLLTVNMGVRGFLTEVDPKDACNSVNKILDGDFKIEKCSKLSGVVNGEAAVEALNDFVVSGGEPSKILYMKIYKDNQPIAQLEADGVILATQTGSTGYSLSAGGPVLDPSVNAIVLTPICSLTTFRSLVFPAHSKITIEPIRPEEMLVLVDGRPFVKKCLTLTVTYSKNTTSFIRFKHEYYKRLENRLLHKGTGLT